MNFLPLCLNHISLIQQTLPHPQSRYLQDAGDQCPSGSDGLAWGPRPQATPASCPLWMPASPSLLRCLCSAPSWKTIYLFMDCPSRPGTALCQLNRMVIQSPNGNCSAHGISVIMSHADKKNTAFRATGETCVLTTNRVTGHHLLFLHIFTFVSTAISWHFLAAPAISLHHELTVTHTVPPLILPCF